MNQANATALIAAKTMLTRIRATPVASAANVIRLARPLFDACLAPLVSTPDNAAAFFHAYFIAAYPTQVFHTMNDTETNVLNHANAVVTAFDAIVHKVAAGEDAPEVDGFEPLVATYLEVFKQWKVINEPHVCTRIEATLRTLHAARGMHVATIPAGMTSELLAQFDGLIARLRFQLGRLGGEERLANFNPVAITVAEEVALIEAVHGVE